MVPLSSHLRINDAACHHIITHHKLMFNKPAFQLASAVNPAIDCWYSQIMERPARTSQARRAATSSAATRLAPLGGTDCWQPLDKTDWSELGNGLSPPLFAKSTASMQMCRAKSCYQAALTRHHHQHQSRLIPLQKFYGGRYLPGRKPNWCWQGCCLLFSAQLR